MLPSLNGLGLGIKNDPKLFAKELNGDERKKALNSQTKITDLKDRLYAALQGKHKDKIYENAFEWRLEFPEVLDEKGDFKGFDLIIGNPPYIRAKHIEKIFRDYYKEYFKEVGNLDNDIYIYFYALGYRLLKENSFLSLITSNKFCRAKYGKNLREYLLKNTTLSHILNLNGVVAFNATVDTMVVACHKQKADKNAEFSYKKHPAGKLQSLEFIENLPQSTILQSTLTKEAFIFGSNEIFALKAKIEKIGTPLKEWDICINYGIKTGYNEAFIIDTKTRNEIINSCKDKAEKERTEKIIKPVLRGKDIERYCCKWDEQWIIGTFPALKLDIEIYPALKTYLEQFMPRLKQSGEKGCRKKTNNKWFETQDNIAYHGDFEKEKIVWNRISSELCFSYDNAKNLILDSMFMITCGDSVITKYFIGVLNSRLAKCWIKNSVATLGEGVYGAKIYIEKLPIPKINSKNSKIAEKIVNLVEQILALKAENSNQKSPSLAVLGGLGR